jgi:DNA-binding transcriptional ArsR family regulator
MTPSTRSKQKRSTPESSGRLFKILSHPLRQRILVSLHDMDEGSPTQLAHRLGEPVGNVSYHVKVLAEAEAIQLVRTEPRRGALEHFYRPIWDQVIAAGSKQGTDGDRANVTWTSLQLDDEGFAAVEQALGETLERLRAIEAEVKTRADGGGRPVTQTEVAILHLERGSQPAR